jgi:hypothetical protein
VLYEKIDLSNASQVIAVDEDFEGNEEVFELGADISPEAIESSRDLISNKKSKSIFVYLTKPQLRDALSKALQRHGDIPLSPSLLARQQLLNCSDIELVHELDHLEHEKINRLNFLGVRVNGLAKKLNQFRKAGKLQANNLRAAAIHIGTFKAEMHSFAETVRLLPIEIDENEKAEV